jgi:hypothetical protein
VIASSNKGLRRSNYNTRELRQLAYVRNRGRRSFRQSNRGVQQGQQLD